MTRPGLTPSAGSSRSSSNAKGLPATKGGGQSACTLVFLAGTPRFVLRTARLGFHRASTGAFSPLIDQLVNRELALTYEKAGLPVTFIERTMMTPPSDMWYPSVDELVNAGLINPSSKTLEVSLPTAKLSGMADFEETLRDNVVWSALEKRAPNTIHAAVRAMLAVGLARESEWLLVDSAGQQVGWMGSIVDITERKRLEETERRHTEAMAHHARLTTLGEVASTLAHELNQPLTAIVSYSAGLSLALKKQAAIEPELLDAMDAVCSNAAQAVRIVHRIRARLSLRDPALQLCDMNTVAQEALDLLKRPLGKSGIRLATQLGSAWPPVLADRVGVEQVITNLVRNAADALGSLGDDRQIRVCTEFEHGAVHLEVSDNGPGLQGRTLETLCASFYSTKGDGMGMGLAICRSIIEAHQGSFSASEAPGGGVSFRFSLPIGVPSQTRVTA